MRKNEIKKKNISANALSDDDLEDVAGGYDIIYADKGEFKESRYKLTRKERKKLEEHGYRVSRDNFTQSWRVSNEADWSISPEDVERVLGY